MMQIILFYTTFHGFCDAKGVYYDRRQNLNGENAKKTKKTK